MGDGFVYKWTNLVNGKWYIGSHEGSQDDRYVGSGLVFRNAILKHGIKNFERSILYSGSLFREEEERILTELDAASCTMSYNLKNESLGGSFYGEDNGMTGKKHSEEAKVKISETLSNGERWGSAEKRVEHASKVFTDIFRNLVRRGNFVSPRGQLVIEVENFSYSLPPFVRFCNFECRKLNLDYVKQEFLWYLKGNKFDQSILEKASMWKNLVNDDGSINSNYGQYVFGDQKQFDDVVKTLIADKDSRRASIVILADRHLKMLTKDVPCTYSLNFRIRDNFLNMSVHMRSQDAIFGMGNDAPAFSMIHEMMLNTLRGTYPELKYGNYFHIADSFHVYERHFEMLNKLTGYEKVDGGFTRREKARLSSYQTVLCPAMSGPNEVEFMRHGDFSSIPNDFRFTKWLVSDEAAKSKK